MKTEKPNNPFAFSYATPQGNGIVKQNGMTLRDYFANSVDGEKSTKQLSQKSVKEIMNVDHIPNDTLENIKFWFELESKLQYMKADAMLKQREL